MKHPPVLLAALTLFILSIIVACTHSPSIQVLTGPPATPFRTIGIVSGQGENESSAMTMLMEQAGRIEADAVIVENQRIAEGSTEVIINARAIKYLAPPR